MTDRDDLGAPPPSKDEPIIDAGRVFRQMSAGGTRHVVPVTQPAGNFFKRMPTGGATGYRAKKKGLKIPAEELNEVAESESDD